MIPVIVLIFCNFAFLKNFVLLETLSSTLAMDQWGWAPQLAVENMGFITMGAGGLGVLVFRFSLVNTLNTHFSLVLVFSMIGPLSKRFDERLLLLCCGILPMIIGRSIMFPFSGDHPPVDCMR